MQPESGDLIICPECGKEGTLIHVVGSREGEPYERFEVSHGTRMHFLDAWPVYARVLMHHGQHQSAR